MSRLDNRFDEFAGGLAGSQGITIAQGERALTTADLRVSVLHVDGMPAGRVAGVTFEVRIQQLELAPSGDLLYSQFELHGPSDNSDPQVALYARTIESLGDLAPALWVLPTNRVITIAGERLPMYRVYHDPYVYEALLHLKRGKARVEIPAVKNPGEILLMALSRQQHTREPSVLEKGDAARRLQETYGYDYDVIALHLARDSESGEAPSVSYISQLIGVSKLHAVVRDLLHRKLITFSHARALLRVRLDETLCAQLATWVCQDGARRTVRALDDLITDLAPGAGLQPLAHLVERGETVVVERQNQEQGQGQGQGSLRLAGGGRNGEDFTGYERVMAARPAQIRREMARFSESITIIAHADPGRVAVTAASFAPLRDWLATRRGLATVRETEAVLLAFLESVRRSAGNAGLLGEHGALAAVVPAQLGEHGADQGEAIHA